MTSDITVDKNLNSVEINSPTELTTFPMYSISIEDYKHIDTDKFAKTFACRQIAAKIP